ncbi:MAG: hypothetical protein V4819_16675 [Verrucomicrobiota bacterium]
MKPTFLLIAALLASVLHSIAAVSIDEGAFGTSLGGWKKRNNSAAEYPLSGSDYRTYKPEVSPTPDGGIFISVRIDHVRGWLASDDHAILEITVSSKGAIASAQSTIAIQGQSIKSDVILGGNEAGKTIIATDSAVQIGTDLVANLTAKLLRENIVEAGRVSLPSVLRHNYNRLFQSIRVDGLPVPPATPAPASPTTATVIPTVGTPPVGTSTVVIPPVGTPTPPPPTAPDPAPVPPSAPVPPPAPGSVPLEIKPYN